MIKSKLFILTFALALLLNIGFVSKKTYADEISFAVSPSKIADYQIDLGETKEIEFSIGNKSVFPKEHTEKNELYKMTVDVDFSLEDSDETEIDSSNILSLDTSSIEIKPNTSNTVTLTISIPSDFEENYYKAYINFSREPISGVESEDGGAYSTIRVPIYLLVGDEENFNKLKADFEVSNFELNVGQANDKFSNIVFDNIKRLFKNPFKSVNTFKEIINKPVYNIKSGRNSIIDINDNMLVEVSKVVTKNNINDWKYVKTTDEQLDKSVKNIKFENTKVSFILEDDEIVDINCSESTSAFIKKQINNIVGNISGMPKLYDLFDEIKVPSNINYNVLDYSAYAEIKNTGEKPIHVTSNVSLMKDNSSIIGEGILKDLTIMTNKSEIISIPLSINGDLSSGNYNLIGDFSSNKIEKKANTKYKIDTNLNLKIFAITLVSYLLILILALTIVVVLYKYINKKRKLNTNK